MIDRLIVLSSSVRPEVAALVRKHGYSTRGYTRGLDLREHRPDLLLTLYHRGRRTGISKGDIAEVTPQRGWRMDRWQRKRNGPFTTGPYYGDNGAAKALRDLGNQAVKAAVALLPIENV